MPSRQRAEGFGRSRRTISGVSEDAFSNHGQGAGTTQPVGHGRGGVVDGEGTASDRDSARTANATRTADANGHRARALGNRTDKVRAGDAEIDGRGGRTRELTGLEGGRHARTEDAERVRRKIDCTATGQIESLGTGDASGDIQGRAGICPDECVIGQRD